MPLSKLPNLLSRTARLGETLRNAQQTLVMYGLSQARFDPTSLVHNVLGRRRSGAAAPQADDPNFRSGEFTGTAGSRPYRLYVPPNRGRASALLVMLHGCTQTAEDFAAGTRMNALAADKGLLVLYPVQLASANAQRCWNWFNPADRRPDGGEAALIAGMARQVMQEHDVDPRRVFAAGLSAGGAQAAALGAAFPDLFAAVGVHSGLACGAASDMPGAFAAMRAGRAGQGHHRMRTIVFHGDRDHTVAAANAEWVADQVAETAAGREETETGRSNGGMSYTRTIRRDAAGRAAVEIWVVHGAGHAWSGGSAAGSYTEPRGPDASAAMVGFFLG